MAQPGMASDRWEIAKLLARGHGLATICYCDVEPDFVGGMQYGARPLFFKSGQMKPVLTNGGHWRVFRRHESAAGNAGLR